MNPNLEKGKRAERAVAKYFRDHGYDADRRVVTGFKVRGRLRADEGDVRGTPGICIQVKDETGSGPLIGRHLDDFMAQTAAQAMACGARIPLLVEKRRAYADPGRWWAWLPQYAFIALIGGSVPIHAWETYPVRIELRDIIDDLVRFSEIYLASETVAV